VRLGLSLAVNHPRADPGGGGSVDNEAAFDAFTSLATNSTTTPTISASHTPVGTPKGVYVWIGQTSAEDQVSGVTYGGEAMARVGITSIYFGTVYGYFLGENIPTGEQTVAVTVTGNQQKTVHCSTVTANGDTALDAHNETSVVATAASLVLATTADTNTVVLGGVLASEAYAADVTPDGDFTQLAETDIGSWIVNSVRRTSNGTGGNITVAWTTASSGTQKLLHGVAIK
jgi:hypothetical protein